MSGRVRGWGGVVGRRARNGVGLRGGRGGGEEGVLEGGPTLGAGGGGGGRAVLAVILLRALGSEGSRVDGED